MKTTENNNLLVSCDEAKHICDKSQYGEATFIELIKLNIRYLYCKVTRAYVRRNIKLTKAIKKSEIQMVSTSIKNEMKKKLQEELTK